jgi:hypothetical protein
VASNAAKYGALASPAGRVTLTPRVEADESGDEFRLLWQEDGGPRVAPPAVAGFGTGMLSQAIEYQHEGSVELDRRKEGLPAVSPCRLQRRRAPRIRATKAASGRVAVVLVRRRSTKRSRTRSVRVARVSGGLA